MYYKVWEWIEQLLEENADLIRENETLYIQLSDIKDKNK